MTQPITFRLPRITVRRSPTFGLPRGTFGRGGHTVQAIVLHALRCSLDQFDAQEQGTYLRAAAEPVHPSLHYGIDYDGNIHQYVMEADVAWGMWDYYQSSPPTPYPATGWSLLAANPGISPDYYVLHIGAMSGQFGAQRQNITATPMPAVALLQHARLIAWLCNAYGISCDTTHVVRHEDVDRQFIGSCIGDALYPYAGIIAAAQSILTAGGEADPLGDPAPTLDEFFGPITIGVTRISSAAYIPND